MSGSLPGAALLLLPVWAGARFSTGQHPAPRIFAA